MTPRFLMCSPVHFGVEYIINPWMQGHISDTDRIASLQQWERLRDLLSKDCEVRLIEAVPGLPDLVFTANAALITGRTAVLSNFRCPERQNEAPHYRRWLEAEGFTVLTLPHDIKFEGAGDALLDRGQRLLWAGYGFRSDLAAAAWIEHAIGIEVQSLHLVDPRFYHLDTCFCPLANGYLLYFAGAFDSESNRAIEQRVPAAKRFSIAEEDAVQFACNAVNLNTRVITNHASPAIREWLKERGFDAVTTNMTEFMKSGGAAKCLSLRLDERP